MTMEAPLSALAEQLLGTVTGENGGAALPSFLYKGEAFSPETWTRDLVRAEEGDDCDRAIIAFDSPDGRLRLQLTYTIYSNYPVVEWLPELIAIGKMDSGIVENFRALDLKMELPPIGTWKEYPVQNVVIRRNLGSKNRVDDFTPQPYLLTDRYPCNRMRMDTDEGRSSAAWLPFFGVDLDEDYGFQVGIGWSGAWSANFALDGVASQGCQLRVDAGTLYTHFRLHPGEHIRQPSIFVMLRDGISVREAMNLHRRFILDCHSPHGADGKPLVAPICASVWGGQPNDTVLSYLETMRKAKMKMDVLWMDAGWFGRDREVASDEFQASDWARTVGDWRVNQVPHPGGLKPISDKAHSMGMKFLLWVEMERAMADSEVVKAHPKWFLKRPGDNPSLMLNLGDENACQWAIDTVNRLVTEEGVDYYREDFNFNTIPYWSNGEAEDRRGVCEAKFIEGLYTFWDAIREQHPDLMIDNCASGGRRIDFETMSRSVCMFRSDIIGRPFYESYVEQQRELLNLTPWVPLQAGSFAMVSGDDYGFLTTVSPGLSFGCGFNPGNVDAAWLNGMLKCAYRMRDLFYADFYPLTATAEKDSWSAYQLNDPETGRGFVAAFRHENCETATLNLNLQDIEPKVKYKLEDRFGNAKELKGSELQSLLVELAEKRSAYVGFYSRVNRPRRKKADEICE